MVEQEQGLLLAYGFPAAAQRWCLRSPKEGLAWNSQLGVCLSTFSSSPLGWLGCACQTAANARCPY